MTILIKFEDAHDIIFQCQAMPTLEDILQNVKFYEYRKTSIWLAVVYNKQWKKYSIHLTRKYSYIKDGETKVESNTIFLPLSADAGLIGPDICDLHKILCMYHVCIMY